MLMNGFVTQHDFFCNCPEPAFHCISILAKQLKKELSPENKKQLIKCLGEDTPTEDAGTGDDIGIGDLEKLFAEDDTEGASG